MPRRDRPVWARVTPATVPRLGMILDMETVGVHLLGGFVAESAR